MFRFANPELLYLLALVPVAIIGYIWAVVSRRRALARFGNAATVRDLTIGVSSARNHLKFTLFLAALTLVIFAVARPQFGSKLREEKSEGVEIMIAVDVSNSMLAEDFEPSRLERTKYAIDKLFEGLQQERVGVIVFAGEAKVQLPITSDYRMAQSFTKRISPNLVSEQGTSIGKALSMAMLSFAKDSDRSQAVILITDGETHDSNALEVAKQAAEHGVKIFTIGIGTPEGAPIRIGGDFIRDEKGEMVVSKLNETMLEEIASTTDAAYVRASKQSIGLEEIVRKINEMEKGELSTLRFEEYNEQFHYLLWIALALLLVEFLLLDRKNPMLSRFNIFDKRSA
ncbi:MAG: VWA domain-containing protein [Alistipes sp.]|nr:VWA domain-containing protein [Alistipes sp.]